MARPLTPALQALLDQLTVERFMPEPAYGEPYDAALVARLEREAERMIDALPEDTPAAVRQRDRRQRIRDRHLRAV